MSSRNENLNESNGLLDCYMMVNRTNDGPGKNGRPRAWLRTAGLLAALFLGAVTQSSRAEPDIRRDATVIAVEQVMPSVVNIATETVIEYHDWYDEVLRQFYGQRGPARRQKSISLGSGVIIDEAGYVLTNFHVVRRASRVQVKLWDGREFDAEPLVATPGSDVALLRIKAKPEEKFRAIRLAADDDLLLGETVLALGNPFGLGSSVTKGILSSKNRRPANANGALEVEDWLQTDATINPGNSGGPLVNLRGELIGLNVAVAREQEGMGMGFSIPIKQVAMALSRFFSPEVRDGLWFGAQFQSGAGGLTISQVQSGSPAARGGLRVGDRLLQVNGTNVNNLIACSTWLSASPKLRASLLVSRGGERRTVTVQLLSANEMVRHKLGLTLVELTAKEAGRLGFRAGQGLLVEDVAADSPASRAQLQRGLLVTAFDDQQVSDLRTLTTVLVSRKAGDTMTLSILIPRRLEGGYVEFRQGNVELTVR